MTDAQRNEQHQLDWAVHQLLLAWKNSNLRSAEEIDKAIRLIDAATQSLSGYKLGFWPIERLK